ncbi:putative uncharacterized protein C6orf183 [Amia ocellicauda]|uniref:putative uncharacterized protein C6orf183 n=1 Tax=Amia ocellicauda TaxID=2972642 RepID=UPI0034645064
MNDIQHLLYREAAADGEGTGLTALKTEIEENGVLQGTPSKAYSSVPVPKDISYFRSERELVLKQELQVAAARPVLVQADVMQRELESCLTREYSPESLPLLLHQVTYRTALLIRSPTTIFL